MNEPSSLRRLLLTIVMLGMVGSCDDGPSSIVFKDIARDNASGITYRRTPSIEVAPGVPPQMKGHGAPGVAIFDYDRDGDMDIYVTNGPGADNALYANQLMERGSLSFVDRAVDAGVGARDQDSTGVCYGDIDNDGDHDLMVLGNSQPNRLFLNRGDGAFDDVTSVSGIGDSQAASVSCSMGDVNGDGLLDIVVANVFNMTSIKAIVEVPFALNEPNQLLVNNGAGMFKDESANSGVTNLDLPQDAPIQTPENAATISWAIALVDYDSDGDVDVFHADDQGDVDNTAEGGINRGLIHVLNNDGTGRFTDLTFESDMNREGGWMGLTFADFDRDGRLDLFGTNFGNHTAANFNGGTLPEHEENDSRWFLQQPDGTFLDSFNKVGRQNTPFGWGIAAEDYDNDGDSDVIYYGGLDLWLFITTAPAVILRNDGNSSFTRDVAAQSSTDHLRRSVNGVASGDLNNDGFIDVVTVSNFDLDETVELELSPALGGEWDADAFYLPISNVTFAGSSKGTVSVEINSASNGNSFIQLELVGMHGITARGRSNRDGIGSIVSVRAEGTDVADMRPVLGGASYASQSSLVMTFGLGTALQGTVDILWPGRTRNRLNNVNHGERIVFPEIPCSLGENWPSRDDFVACLDTSLGEIQQASVINADAAARFRESMLNAFDAQGGSQ